MSDFGNLVGDGDISDACIAEFSSCGLAVDCMKTYLTDAIEYVGDLHTLTKVKVSGFNFKILFGNYCHTTVLSYNSSQDIDKSRRATGAQVLSTARHCCGVFNA